MERGVSEFRKQKYSTFFNFMDRDGDGYLTKNDFIENVNNLRTELKSTDNAAAFCHRQMLSWWPLYEEYAAKHGGLIDKDYFVEKVTEYLSNNNVIHDLNHHFATIFRFIDQNGDGAISFDEFKAYYRSHGWTDDNQTRIIFDKLDTDKDGVISMDEFIHPNTQFFLSDDPKTGFEFLYKRI